MVQLDLTSKQVEELKNHYILELEKLQARSAEIMGILSKLVHEPIAPLPDKQVDLTQPTAKTEVKTRQKGRPAGNLNLGGFIIQLLQEKNKPLTSEQIIHEYKKKNQIDLSASTATMASLNQTLFRLRKKQNLITSTRRKGKKGNIYALVGQADTPVLTATIPLEKKEDPSKEPKQATSKYNWHQFILDTLNKHKRTLSLKDFLGYAMVQYSIPAQDKRSIYGKISPVLTQMAKAKDKIRTFKKDGTTRKFYALNDWFNDRNEMITIYK